MEVSEQDVLGRIRAAVKVAGSLRAFGVQHHLSAAYVHDVLNGRRILGERICAAVGVDRTVQTTYIVKQRTNIVSDTNAVDTPDTQQNTAS